MTGKIFIVDDEAHITRSLVRELSEWGNDHDISFITLNNPLEVMNSISQEGDVFLVISDLRMPEMTGSDLLLKIHKEYPDIITILLTGYSEVEEIMKAIKAGIFSYILKPWDEKYLIAEVNKAYDLYKTKRDRRKYIEMLDEELKWGGELQKTLLMREFPKPDKVEFFVEYQPLPKLYCGGDYYDIIQLSRGRFLVLMGDVAGHGLKAAFITTILKTIIYSGYIRDHRDDERFSPAGFLYWLNSRVNEELSRFPDMLITFVVLLVDIPEKKMIFSNAGQQHFFLIRDDKYYPVYREGICLNITDKPKYLNVTFKLKSHDKIFLFTDGLIEITENRTSLTNEQTGSILLDSTRNGYALKEIIDEFKKVSAQQVFLDDVTLMLIRLM